MIRTLVVDDDYRVAKIHAAGIDRVPGFSCVGQAHSAAEARQAVADLAPELLLLDIYLPDEDGLAILRGLNSAGGAGPDCIVITAARDLETVRTAMHLGAVYYLVKPFGFAQLRDQLDAYRRWRQQTSGSGDADQATVDALYNLLKGPAAKSPPAAALPPTMQKILEAIQAAPRPIGASALAAQLGLSRPTAQRYLTELHRRGAIRLHLEYGRAGRPVHHYAMPDLSPANGSP
jgi:response regulator of citrate/malate metabolism